MLARFNKRKLAAGGFFSVMLFFFAGVPGIVSIVRADPPPPACATQVHFFAGDVANNFFGPAADGNVDQLKSELHNRRCADPALVVAHAHDRGYAGFAELNSDDAFTGKIRELIANPQLWRDVITLLEAQENDASTVVSIESMTNDDESLMMIDGVTDVPLIRTAHPAVRQFPVLRFAFSDGSAANYKLDCGFQPIKPTFPNVPPESAPPPPNQPPPGPPPTVPPTTAPPTTRPPVTTTSKPPTSEECQQNGTGPNCPFPPVQQPVQDNDTSGVDTGPTPGAPADEPPPADRPSGDPNGGSGDGGAAPPTGPTDDSDADQVTEAPPPGEDLCPLGPGNC